MTQSDRSKEWEKEFDKEFDEFYLPIPDEVRKELKDYIFAITESLLSQQRADFIEKVEKLRGAKYVVIRTSDKAITGPMDKTLINKNDVLQLLKGEL